MIGSTDAHVCHLSNVECVDAWCHISNLKDTLWRTYCVSWIKLPLTVLCLRVKITAGQYRDSQKRDAQSNAKRLKEKIDFIFVAQTAVKNIYCVHIIMFRTAPIYNLHCKETRMVITHGPWGVSPWFYRASTFLPIMTINKHFWRPLLWQFSHPGVQETWLIAQPR